MTVPLQVRPVLAAQGEPPHYLVGGAHVVADQYRHQGVLQWSLL